jgi:hypothetical protein
VKSRRKDEQTDRWAYNRKKGIYTKVYYEKNKKNTEQSSQKRKSELQTNQRRVSKSSKSCVIAALENKKETLKCLQSGNREKTPKSDHKSANERATN